MSGPGTAQDSATEDLEKLMEGYQRAEAGAASLLVERLSPQLFHYFLGQVRDRSQAEDLLQDLWLRVHKARRTYRPGEPVLPWIFAIARRARIDDYRRRSRITRHEFQSDVLPESSVEKTADDSPHHLEDMLKTLPASQREILLLLKVAGLSLEEVARATGTSVGAVKQKAHRAYEALRKLFRSPS
jgi:RNA polymerase sigma-70 factor (ECF subfamily)